MRHAELLADLAQIARRAALVLHHGGAADHFQVGDLRQVGQDLVLHAIGEEGVRFFFAQIFERKHRDAFFRDSSERTSRSFAQEKENRQQQARPATSSAIATAAQRTWARCCLTA